LLAEKREQAQQFDVLLGDLSASGVAVLGSKILTDPGRSDQPEIRYFDATDKAQAKKLSEFIKFRLSTRTVSVNQLQDATERPGYIEIWLARCSLRFSAPTKTKTDIPLSILSSIAKEDCRNCQDRLVATLLK
jgi:hypothetical protein